MRQRVCDYYRGIERIPYGRIKAVAYEATWKAVDRQLEIDSEHEILYGFRPALNRA